MTTLGVDGEDCGGVEEVEGVSDLQAAFTGVLMMRGGEANIMGEASVDWRDVVDPDEET